MKSPLRSASNKGFSLVEILAVLAIGAILFEVTISGLTTLVPMNFDRSVSTVAGILDECHSYALAHNTYVYVGLSQQTTSTARPEIWMAGVASATGVDISEAGTVPVVIDNANNGILIQKMIKLPNLLFEPGAQISDTVVSRPANALSIDTSGTPLGPLQQVTLNVLFWFGPDGTVANATSSTRTLEFGLASPVSQRNINVLQVAGLTGITRVYNP